MTTTPNDWTIDYFLANEAECHQVLENIEALQKIPSLNSLQLDSLKDGQLVHFQGMLQDVHDSEFYFKNYEVVNKTNGQHSVRCGMYIDGACCQPDEDILIHSNLNENAERQTWFVISTPGLNDWAKKSDTKTLNKNVLSTEHLKNDNIKRTLDQIETPMDCSEPVRKKEKVSTENMGTSTSQSTVESKTQIISKDHILNFPIPNIGGKACIVKVYKNFTYKLNDVIDIVGFISLNPYLSEIYDSEEMTNDLERQTHNPPASIVPRLHAIKIVPEINKYVIDSSIILSKAESIRADLQMVLSQLFFGDEIAANYVICHLISSVYLRKDILCLGAFPLNITNFPLKYKNFTKEIYEIFKQILTKSHMIDITIETLNKMSLVPKKDYECNRLTSGILQLSKNTHLFIDETGLTPGQVTECGKENYNAINNVIQFQKLAYNFKFQSMEYETDIPVLILSEIKSFIPCQNQVILKLDPDNVKIYSEVVQAAKLYLKDENRLNNLRDYVNSLKHAKLELSDEISNIIQCDFVKLRQSYNKFSSDNLHSLLVFSRLMSLSHGLNKLSPEIWKKSLDMEMERMSRLPNHN